jgi:hypothetical protein
MTELFCSAVTSPTEQLIVPLRTGPAGVVPPITGVRSTLLASSLMALKERDLLPRYLENLPPSLHSKVLHSVAGSWLPVDIGVAHYTAADRLELSAHEQFEIGRSVAERVQNGMLGTLVRLAKTAGVTPWTGLQQFQRLWDRLLQGGSGAVYRLGPKEARVEIHGVSLVSIAYFRNGWRGMFAGSGQLFASKVYVTEISRQTTRTSMALRVAWA